MVFSLACQRRHAMLTQLQALNTDGTRHNCATERRPSTFYVPPYCSMI